MPSLWEVIDFRAWPRAKPTDAVIERAVKQQRWVQVGSVWLPLAPSHAMVRLLAILVMLLMVGLVPGFILIGPHPEVHGA
jgi:hypothetical protein